MPQTPEHSKFKKGQSGNPNGRPKGRRNRATLVREWLEVAQNVKNPLTGEMEQLEQQDLIVLALIKKARSGDVQAAKELMDSAHGKITDRLDMTSDGDKITQPTWIIADNSKKDE